YGTYIGTTSQERPFQMSITVPSRARTGPARASTQVVAACPDGSQVEVPLTGDDLAISLQFGDFQYQMHRLVAGHWSFGEIQGKAAGESMSGTMSASTDAGCSSGEVHFTATLQRPTLGARARIQQKIGRATRAELVRYAIDR